MASLGDRLGESLVDPGPVPSGSALVRYAGGRRALAQQLSGMDGAPKATEYGGKDTDAFRAASNRWRSAQRRAQRADEEGKTGKQRRESGLRLTPEQRERVREQAAERKEDQLAARGMRARMRATVLVPSPRAKGGGDKRVRDMPSGGPGVLISPAVTRDILRRARELGEDWAADMFQDEFLRIYGMPDDVVLDEVMWVKTWPEGTPEPPR